MKNGERYENPCLEFIRINGLVEKYFRWKNLEEFTEVKEAVKNGN